MKIPEPAVVEPLSKAGLELFSALGKISGIYAFVIAGRITHLSWSANLSRRIWRLLSLSDGAPNALAHRLHMSKGLVHCWPTSSRLESALTLYELAKSHFTDDYLARLRLRLPWFVVLTDKDHFARLTVTNRLGKGDSTIGPFRNRDSAQRYQDEILSSFVIRRCVEDLKPTPEHPGCIYGEINLCLRPCQAVVNQTQYAHEAKKVEDFLQTNGKSVIASLSKDRDNAAADTDFERAAQIHKRIEKLKSAADSRDEIITEIGSFNGVAVTKGPVANEIRLWPMLAGYWQNPITLNVDQADTRFVSWDRRLRELLTPVFSNPVHDEGCPTEQLAVFARWYYSSWRDGDWIVFPNQSETGYRKLVRSILKLAKVDAGMQTKTSW